MTDQSNPNETEITNFINWQNDTNSKSLGGEIGGAVARAGGYDPTNLKARTEAVVTMQRASRQAAMGVKDAQPWLQDWKAANATLQAATEADMEAKRKIDPYGKTVAPNQSTTIVPQKPTTEIAPVPASTDPAPVSTDESVGSINGVPGSGAPGTSVAGSLKQGGLGAFDHPLLLDQLMAQGLTVAEIIAQTKLRESDLPRSYIDRTGPTLVPLAGGGVGNAFIGVVATPIK